MELATMCVRDVFNPQMVHPGTAFCNSRSNNNNKIGDNIDAFPSG